MTEKSNNEPSPDEPVPEGTPVAEPTAPPSPRPTVPRKPRAPKPVEGQPEAPAVIPQHLFGLGVGRIVHFVVPDTIGKRPPIHRAAIVTHVHDHAKGIVSLTVFIVKSDYPKNHHPGNVLLAEGVAFSEDHESPSTWHWPEKV